MVLYCTLQSTVSQTFVYIRIKLEDACRGSGICMLIPSTLLVLILECCPRAAFPSELGELTLLKLHTPAEHHNEVLDLNSPSCILSWDDRMTPEWNPRNGQTENLFLSPSNCVIRDNSTLETFTSSFIKRIISAYPFDKDIVSQVWVKR